jgi:hypothetical protein
MSVLMLEVLCAPVKMGPQLSIPIALPQNVLHAILDSMLKQMPVYQIPAHAATVSQYPAAAVQTTGLSSVRTVTQGSA